MKVHNLEDLFHPRSIAIVGASNKPATRAYAFVSNLINYGYRGKIYPVSPHLTELLGIKAYASVSEIPESIDYVISCVAASRILDLIDECGKKNVKFMQLYTARFAETGKAEGVKLQKEILDKVRKFGIRLVGPNCLGVCYPKEGISFDYHCPREPGKVAILSQSGGNVLDIIRSAGRRGIHFSKIISYGNAIDLNEVDFLEYLLQDPETQIIAAYMEGPTDGRRLWETLRRASLLKPVIILKGGKGNAGAKAAASHTAALAGSFRIWETALRQAGAIEAETLHDMIDLLVAFCALPPILGKRVGIVGGGGGMAVLSADEWEKAGFTVVPLPPEIEELVRKSLPEQWWGWVGNPVDISIIPLELRGGFGTEMLDMMARTPSFDLLVSNIMISGPYPKGECVKCAHDELKEIISVVKRGTKPAVVVLNADNIDPQDCENMKVIGEMNDELIAANIPFFGDSSEAAKAVAGLVHYYQKRALVRKS